MKKEHENYSVTELCSIFKVSVSRYRKNKCEKFKLFYTESTKNSNNKFTL